MKKFSHPVLFIDKNVKIRLRRKPCDSFHESCFLSTINSAKYFAKMPPLAYQRGVHNEHLLRAREMQGRIVTLLCAWEMTGERRFSEAVINCVKVMKEWECWSWITWRQKNYAPDAIFDLSYGENSATLAIAYDWLFDTLSHSEKKLFVETAEKWSFASAIKHAKKGGAWWFGNPMSNWNTVCAGGMAMLAMAMYDEVASARKILPLLNKSILPFFHHLKKSGGAWPEGIGYWNYGMRYGFMYLLSYENFYGKKHPVFDMPEFRATLRFPIEFCPNGVGCSFGDVNHWTPMPLHLAVANRIKDSQTANALKLIANREKINPYKRFTGWPIAPEWCLFYDSPPKCIKTRKTPIAKLYKGQLWGVFSDDFIAPTRAMTVRGGTTKVPHGHLDLLSFHCVVGDQSMITNLSPAEYLDTTFSPRRWDIFEMRPDSKNTILINGVGILPDSSCDNTTLIKVAKAIAIRMEATSAFGNMRDGRMAKFVGRLIVFIRGKYWIIVDRVKTLHPARMENRMHTFADVKMGKNSCVLRKGGETLNITYVSTVPSVLVKAAGAPTTPSVSPATMMRWVTEKLQTEVINVTVLNPGTEKKRIELIRELKKIKIIVAGKKEKEAFVISPKLMLLAAQS